MPIYEYRRPDGTTFDIQQSFSDEPLKVDPETGVPVERVLHPPAVHFKGKGFYNTDYGTRKRQRETAAAADKKSSSDGASSAGDSSSSSTSDGKGAKDTKPDSGAKSSTSESKPVAAKS
jgi:predicted nucleic acid-binding Zn ribbon protein